MTKFNRMWYILQSISTIVRVIYWCF